MNNFPNEETLLLVDGDILLYSIGFGSEDVEEEWIVDIRIENFFKKLFDKFKIYNYKVYLTGKGNFREQSATTHTYKGNRTKAKPKWYSYIKDYLVHMHRTEVVEGMEADDGISMNLTRNPNSIHVGIDKDILQVQGWHYRYATHNSPEVPLRFITEEGFLELQVTEKTNAKGVIVRKKKLIGGGNKWFFAQMLLGDKTDHIFGLDGYGDVKVYDTLKECESYEECFEAVKLAYEEQLGDNAHARMLENGDLLWMVRGFNIDGELLTWSKTNSHRFK